MLLLQALFQLRASRGPLFDALSDLAVARAAELDMGPCSHLLKSLSRAPEKHLALTAALC